MIVRLIRKILPSNIKLIVRKKIINKIISYRFKNYFENKVQRIRSNYANIIFIVATPRHSNLGDHAIVYAELKLLEDIGLRDRVVEISNSDYLDNKVFISKYISLEDVLIIDGGGNLGTLWPMEDDKITEIIDTYSRNTIIVFPQTCFYTSSMESNERLLRNRRIYQRAKNLIITLRDRRSYEFCVNNFVDVQFMCIPDIVLYINNLKNKKKDERKDILLCFRKDLEKVVSNADVEKLKCCLSQKDIVYSETSTLTNYAISEKQRNTELFNKWDEFSSAKLVITDRLHGMIFAAITGTPCLAIDNLSNKVSGVYNLVPKIDYIQICGNLDDVLVNIEKYYYMGINNEYGNSTLECEYQKIKDIITNEISK